MKKYIISSFLFICTLLSTRSFSQGLAVNTDASTANPSAMLDVKATNKGVLIPRLVSTAAVTSPVTGLLIYQTSSPAGFYYYDGAGWLLLQNSGQVLSVTTTEILDSTITDSDISASAAISYSKLSLSNSIQNADLLLNSVTTSKVANGTVTTNKMADSAISGLKLQAFAVWPRHINTTGASTGQALIYDGSSVNWAAPATTGTAGGSLAGTYPNPGIAPAAVTTTEILDSTITDSDISPTAAISYSKLSLTNSIQNADLLLNSVTTSKVANGTVTTSKMADSALSGQKLQAFAVSPRHINTTGASAGQAMMYDGSVVNWATPAGGGSFPAIITDPTALTSITTSGTYQNMQSITLPSIGRYLITAFVNITTQQTSDEYNARITHGGTILTGSSAYYSIDDMMSLSTVVNITVGNIGTPVLIQSKNSGAALGTAVGTYSVVKLSN